ncbi:MAG: sulfatase [Limisphaerales bacterium]|nr:MAG: sulfatase [Limisphaerales bacterium]
MKPLRSALFALLSVLCAFALNSLAAARPNVLLICVDDLKPALGCYGDALAKSPNLDRLAARAVQFNRAFCNQAVCSPSRNSLMTSLRPQTLGIYDLPTHFRKGAPGAVTVGQFFKRHGYRTEGLGKIFHTGHGNIDDADSWSVPSWRSKAGGYALKESTEGARDTKLGPRGAAYESADVPDNKYGDGMIADEAIERLRAAKAKAGEPFFLAVGFLKPHLPFVAPKKYWDLYDRNTFKLAQPQTPPVGAPSYAPQSGGELRNYKDMPAKGTLPDDLQRTLIHGYYAATSYMDAQAGRVLAELDKLGLAANTIVVLWGDHGWHLGDHGIWCKHTNYEQAARIPVLVAGPGVKAGAKTASLVETVDIYPTLAELAGLPAPAGLDGRSFAATLRDPAAPHRDHAIHVYPRSAPDKGSVLGRAIRTERHRLVEWKKPGAPAATAELELYDYQADPLETKNLAAEQPEVIARLRALLAKHPEAKPQISAAAAKQADAKAAPAKGKQDRNAMFDSRDKNKDGKLSREEFLANQPDPDKAPARFPQFDTNKDGFLSREEFVTSGGKNK